MTEKSGFSIWGKKNLNPSTQTQQNTQQSNNNFPISSSNRPNNAFNRSDQNVINSSPSFLQDNPNNKKIYNNNNNYNSNNSFNPTSKTNNIFAASLGENSAKQINKDNLSEDYGSQNFKHQQPMKNYQIDQTNDSANSEMKYNNINTPIGMGNRKFTQQNNYPKNEQISDSYDRRKGINTNTFQPSYKNQNKFGKNQSQVGGDQYQDHESHEQAAIITKNNFNKKNQPLKIFDKKKEYQTTQVYKQNTNINKSGEIIEIANDQEDYIYPSKKFNQSKMEVNKKGKQNFNKQESFSPIKNKIKEDSSNLQVEVDKYPKQKLKRLKKKNSKDDDIREGPLLRESNHIPESQAKPKPKIDLKKVNELENKRKEIIKTLERDDFERSPSPDIVNMVRTAEHPKINREENSFTKDKPNDYYVPKNMKNLVKTERAKLTTMCSAREMKEREEQNLLNVFEANPETSYYDSSQKRYVFKVNPDCAVKVFSRPAADTVMDDPDNIRTPEVLTKTINYILDEIIDIDKNKEKMKKMLKPNGVEINFENISKFVEDRFRSIRQDFTILNLKGDKNNIDGHEKIARFLILCLNETLDYDAFSGQQSLFKLYVQQLNATLTSLREFYEYVNINIETDSNCYFSLNQAEFFSYSILLSMKETFDLVSMLNKMPEYILNSDIIKLTKKIVRAIMGKEWLSFFRILKSKECSYLLSCVMSLYFKEMRVAALSELSHSYGIKIKDSYYKTTINKLNEILLFQDEDECVCFLEWFGDDINFSNEENLDLLDTPFELVKVGLVGEDANLPRKTNKRFIEWKQNGLSRCDIIK